MECNDNKAYTLEFKIPYEGQHGAHVENVGLMKKIDRYTIKIVCRIDKCSDLDFGIELKYNKRVPSTETKDGYEYY